MAEYQPGQQVGHFTVVGPTTLPAKRGKYETQTAGYIVRCRCGREVAFLRYRLDQVAKGHKAAPVYCSARCPLLLKAVSERSKHRDDDEHSAAHCGLTEAHP